MDIISLLVTILLVAAIVNMVYFAIKLSVQRRSTYKRYKAFLSVPNALVIFWNTDMKILQMNEEMRNKLRECEREADSKLLVEIFSNDKNEKNYSVSTILVNALSKKGRESTLVKKNGIIGYYHWDTEIIDTVGNVTNLISVGIDISSTIWLKAQLEEHKRENFFSKENFSLILETACIGVISITLENYDFKVRLSPNTTDMFKFSPNEEVTIDSITKKIHGADTKKYVTQLNKLLSGGIDELNLQIKMQITQGIYHDVLVRLKNIKNNVENSIYITGVLIDLTNQRDSYSMVDKANYEDSLTGLANRRGFMSEGITFLKNTKINEKNAAVICIKLNRFQKTGVLFGLETADVLLKLYADTITRLSKGNMVIAKIGVDDFAVMMNYEESSEIEEFLRELKIVVENSCNNEILPQVLKEQCGFSAGIAFYDGVDDVMTIYNKASITLYTADDSIGGHIFYFDEGIENRVYERELIEQELGKALRNNEFELYYQPKISFKTGEIIGAEALMRWNHPEKGILMPAMFIPLAEETGNITKIDNWGLAEACMQNKCWQNKGYKPISVSVNMSQAQLYQTDIASTIEQVLDHTELSPKYLEVELTETMAIMDLERTLAVLSKIKQMGVSVSMDDFGTGYSSLSALKTLPIDVLKIDRSLVYDITENENARCITKAIVDLGKAMNLVVLAEGVETNEQRKLLTDLGCDIAQGYFYGKPLTVKEMEKLFLIPTLQVR